MGHGESCAMTIGTVMMGKWSADNLDTPMKVSGMYL